MNLTAVIPFFNGHKTIDRLLESLPDNLPVIIIDDLSDARLWAVDKENVRIIWPNDKGYFTGAVNRGISECDTDILILNQDVWFEGDAWLQELKLLRQTYDLIGDPVQGHPAWPQGYIQGTFMYISRECINEVGLLNERDYPLWGSTCEYQLRAYRKGFKAHPWPTINKWMRHEDRKRGGFGTAITEVLRREPENKLQFIRTPPAVSVIVPCYNYGKYLPDCINSLIGGPTCLGEMEGQTFQSFEIIIVDDCSTDDTPKIARELADPWKAVHYIRLPKNRGTAGAINAGIKKAKGQFITILSADDMRESWSLEKLYRVVEKEPRIVPYDDMMILKEGQRIHHQRLQNYDFDKLIFKNQMPAGIMFARSAWEEVGGYPEEMRYGREDWAFGVALGVHGYCGKRLEEPGYLYRRENQNRSKRNQGWTWHQKFLKQIQRQWPKIYEGERPVACCGRGNDKGPVSSKTNGVVAMGGIQTMPGAEGFVLIEYIGSNSGDSKWRPTGSNVKYVFGGVRKTGHIAKDHLEWFLGRVENRKKLFRVANAETEPVEITEEQATAINQTTVLDYSHLEEYYTYSLSKLKRLELLPDEWQHLLDVELAKVNQRTTVVNWLQEQTETELV